MLQAALLKRYAPAKPSENGNTGETSVNKSTDFVDVTNKYVLSANGNIALLPSIEYALCMYNNMKLSAYSDSDLAKCAGRIRDIYTVHEVLSLVDGGKFKPVGAKKFFVEAEHAADVDGFYPYVLKIRPSDTVPVAIWDATTAAKAAKDGIHLGADTVKLTQKDMDDLQNDHDVAAEAYKNHAAKPPSQLSREGDESKWPAIIAAMHKDDASKVMAFVDQLNTLKVNVERLKAAIDSSEVDESATDHYAVIAQKIHSMKIAGDENSQSVLKDSHFPFINLSATCVHRQMFQGHEFFTKKLDDMSDPSTKLCAMAAESIDEFVTWCKVNSAGHDTWHFLDDVTKEVIVHGMSGEFEFIVAPGKRWGGNPVGGARLSDVVKLDEAISDRIPFGTSGVAGIIKGMDQVSRFLSDIFSKVQTEDIEPLSQLVADFKVVIAGRLPRKVLIQLRNSLRPVIAFATGYVMADEISAVGVRKFAGLMNYIKSADDRRGMGYDFAKNMKDIPVNPQAMAKILAIQVGEFVSALKSVTAAGDIVLNEDTIESAMKFKGVIPETLEQRRLRMEEDEAKARNMKMLAIEQAK
jgi:hypothetical protein